MKKIILDTNVWRDLVGSDFNAEKAKKKGKELSIVLYSQGLIPCLSFTVLIELMQHLSDYNLDNEDFYQSFHGLIILSEVLQKKSNNQFKDEFITQFGIKASLQKKFGNSVSNDLKISRERVLNLFQNFSINPNEDFIKKNEENFKEIKETNKIHRRTMIDSFKDLLDIDFPSHSQKLQGENVGQKRLKKEEKAFKEAVQTHEVPQIIAKGLAKMVINEPLNTLINKIENEIEYPIQFLCDFFTGRVKGVKDPNQQLFNNTENAKWNSFKDFEILVEAFLFDKKITFVTSERKIIELLSMNDSQIATSVKTLFPVKLA